jgi:hypothetical protein
MRIAWSYLHGIDSRALLLTPAASLLRKKNDVAAAKATIMIPTMIIAVQVTSVTSKLVAISPDMARYEIKRNDGTQRKNLV